MTALSKMYNFIVSCYYWPSSGARLRLRLVQIEVEKKPRRWPAQAANFTSVTTTPSAIERRQAQRLNVRCEVELRASLSILDTDAGPTANSLVFLGMTKDLSASGLAFVLPSTLIDERYCGGSERLRVFLQLPSRSVSLEVNPVHCQAFGGKLSAVGYLIGTKILSIDDDRDQYDQYIRSISDLTLER